MSIRTASSEHFYAPHVGSFHAGDIILTFNALGISRIGRIKSRVIRFFSRGSFSHAMICSHPPGLIEAIGPGVSKITLDRVRVNDIANVRVLRYHDRVIAAEAGKHAEHELGKDYSLPLAIESIFPQDFRAKIKNDAIFCSALVAQAYICAGATEFKVL